jgi:hypothetical protein
MHEHWRHPGSEPPLDEGHGRSTGRSTSDNDFRNRSGPGMRSTINREQENQCVSSPHRQSNNELTDGDKIPQHLGQSDQHLPLAAKDEFPVEQTAIAG